MTMINTAIKIVKLLLIPFTILLHIFAIYGVYLYSGITILSSIFIVLTVISMFGKLKKVIGMTRRRAELMMEVDKILKSGHEDDDFKKNNDIWNNQTDE